MKLKGTIKKRMTGVKIKGKDKAPQIFMVLAVIGYGVSIYQTAKATPKVSKSIDEAKELKFNQLVEETGDEELSIDNIVLNRTEVIKATYKHYIIPASLFLGSTILIGFSNKIMLRRTAALASSAQIAREAYNRYRETVKEHIGKDKAADILHESNKKDLEKIESNPNITMPKKRGYDDEILFIEPFTGRPFYSTINKIKEIENNLNYNLINYGCASLNDYFYMLGLAQTDLGERLGWDIDKHGKLKIGRDPQETQDHKPCFYLVFEDNNMPSEHYWRCA